MAQNITMISNGDWFNGSKPLAIPLFTGAANTTLILTVSYWSSPQAMSSGNKTAIETQGWTEIFSGNAGNASNRNIYAHVFKRNVGGAPITESIPDISNPDTVGTAFTIVELSGNVTGVGTLAIANDPVPGGNPTTYNVPDISSGFLAGNSTYAITISGADSSGAGGETYVWGPMSDPALDVVEHILTPDAGDGPHGGTPYDLSTTDTPSAFARGSANQHYFAPATLVPPTAEYTEITTSAAISTSVIMLEVLGDALTLPILSAPSVTDPSSTQITVNATTNSAEGTLNYVIATTASNDLDGVSVAQVKAGQNAAGSAVGAGFSGSFTVTSTSISTLQTGLTLTSGVGYDLVMTQTNGVGDTAATLTTTFTAGTNLTLPTATGISTAGVTVGASTDVTGGNHFVVIDTAANLSGVTAAQVKLGQKANSTAALASGTAANSVSPFTLAIVDTLTNNTTFTYAFVQELSGADSNILTSTFTVGVVNNFGFRLPVVDSTGGALADGLNFIADVYSDIALASQIGAQVPVVTTSGGNLEVDDLSTGQASTPGVYYYTRIRRDHADPAWTDRDDNIDVVFETKSVDLDGPDTSI